MIVAVIIIFPHRNYSPEMGRFLQVDPDPGKIGNAMTHINKTIYGGNNPANTIDPSGKSFWKSLVKWGGLVATTAMFGPIAGLAYINYSGMFSKSEKDFANGLAIVIAAVSVGIAIGAATGGSAWAILLGAGAGGLIGGFGYEATGLGSFREGFIIGAIYGAFGGMMGMSMYGGSSAAGSSGGLNPTSEELEIIESVPMECSEPPEFIGRARVIRLFCPF